MTRIVLVPFKGLLFLYGPRAAETCIDCSILGITTYVLMLAPVFIALRLTITISCFSEVSASLL